MKKNQGASISQIIEKQVLRSPNCIAVTFEGHQLTYSELNARANQLAHYLQDQGIATQTRIGICVERSLEMVIGLLGTLKAGATYVPLDPAHPVERTRLVLEDAKVACILTQKHLVNSLLCAQSRVICLDDNESKITQYSEENLELANAADEIAYLIYTSGSTGKPKGVQIPHQGVINLLTTITTTPGMSSEDKVVAVASICFDISVADIFFSLMVGAHLIIASTAATTDAVELGKLLQTSEATIMQATPATWQMLRRCGWQGQPGLNIWSTGEALPRTLADWLLKQGTSVWNLYGPTEATIWTTIAQVQPGTDSIPIGRPIANTQVYVLDEQLKPVADGEVGELYIGGVGLAVGYLNRPQLTAERFIPNPFDPEGQTRLYKTGDLVRFRPDGQLDYLGRIDHQVKIRGFRIELGEIEAVLNQLPTVQETVVVAREDRPGDKQLAAYLIPSSEESSQHYPTPIDLRNWLVQQLPHYMIPAAFMFLEAFPLNSNGKVDRNALPVPDLCHFPLQSHWVAPQTAVEHTLAEIWSTVLAIEKVGIEDHWLDLGGHSLLATQIIAQIRTTYGIDLPLRCLFEAPTIATLAPQIETQLDQHQSTEIPTIQPLPQRQNLPLSFAQARLWFLDQLEPNQIRYNVPAAVRLTGELNLQRLSSSLNQIIQRHEVLRTTFTTLDGEPQQVIQPVAELALSVINLETLPPADRETAAQQILLQETQQPFDLSADSLFRVKVIQFNPQDSILLMVLHHILCDDWSMNLLCQELSLLYNANNGATTLPELRIQYGDFALWQRQWLQGEVLETQLNYWRQQIADLPKLQLPTDHPRPTHNSDRGARQSFQLSQPLTTALMALSRQEGVTLFMTLLAAFQVLLYRYTGQEDVAVATPVANRHHSGIESLIGFFVNIVMLRTNLSGAPSFRGLLQRVRPMALEAYSHQDLPFEKLVEALHSERSFSGQPLFDVVFALQNRHFSQQLQLDGLQHQLIEIDNGTAKCDLLLQLIETPEGLTGYLEYCSDLFEAETINRMVGHFQTLLTAIVTDANQPITKLSMLTPGEMHQLLVTWNDTQTDYPQDRCIHQLFEAQVQHQPDAVAVVFGEEHLTYDQLNCRANQLAHHLQQLGVAPEVFVGINLERSPEMMIAVLAVTKAGGAYIPFDPHWPTERMQQILSSQQLGYLITQSSQLQTVQQLQWQQPHLNHIICVDVHTPKPEPESLDPDTIRLLWDHVAEQAVNRASAGGFISSYTGKCFLDSEIDEYIDHVVGLAQPDLNAEQQVLEIGCGSGLIMYRLAPQVKRYVGVDPSGVTQQRNQDFIRQQGYHNIELVTAYAHELEPLKSQQFDLILLASTIQFFPGYFYLQQVIAQALEQLVPGGKIIIADVLDLAQKAAFKQSLATDQDASKYNATQLNNGLYIDQQFFIDLQSELTQIAAVSVQKRMTGFNNELRYRYDVVLQKAEATSTVQTPIQPTTRPNHLWTQWHLQQQPDHNPSTFVCSHHTAYIIYTSGSTGVPKGVVVRHQPVVNLIDWVNRTFKVGSTDQILFVTSLCFDLSVYDIFGLLAAGGSIYIASETQQKSPEQLLLILRSQPITFWDSAPAVLQQLVPFFDSIPATATSSLRLVFLSGDWIPTTLPDALKQAFPGTQVMGLGGATEATIWSNYYDIHTVDPQWVSIPYGKPIQNARYHILDAHLNPCPIGVPGDLYIGGNCLATGYANDPVKTAQRFIADPFSPEPEARLYHTGDLAQYLPDGNIEFLGRLDHQVKIRGFRIELGEIETALRRHPAVRHTVVMAREDIPGQKRLVAYLLTCQTLSVAHLRSYLREKLPEYMIPAVFMMLEAFPLTPNGKIDRKALPVPEINRCDLEAKFVAPQTPIQQQIATIWSELLGIDSLGIHDHFFELGGNSLLAARAIARMQDTLEMDTPVGCLFEFPTIVQLAEQLDNTQTIETKPATINLKADVVLPWEICPQDIVYSETISQPNHIFLTGSTGFLGAFLIDELLRKTSATLYCLVRATDTKQGMKKLQKALEKYRLWQPEFSNRMIPVPGDLEKPLLGLTVDQFNQLAAQIDTIYHGGAQVNFVKPYSMVKAANVLGTQAVIQLAVQSQIKPLHYISTAGVFGPVSYFENCQFLFENEDIEDYEEYVALDLGYSQSKWVAEQLVKIAQSRGLPVTIMRPGFMLGHPETGVTNTTDFWSRFIKGCLEMGYFPELVNQGQEFIPINYVSETIVHLSMQSNSIGKVFHLTPPEHNLTTIELFELIQSLGYSLQSLPYSQWKKLLIQQTKQSPNHALVPLLPIFTEKVYKDLTIMELYQNNPEYDCHNTIAGLQGTSIQCPKIDQALVKTYLSYFMEIGFIKSSVTAKVG